MLGGRGARIRFYPELEAALIDAVVVQRAAAAAIDGPARDGRKAQGEPAEVIIDAIEYDAQARSARARNTNVVRKCAAGVSQR